MQGGTGSIADSASRPPEAEAIRFARGMRIPVLKVNGRNIFRFPVATSPLPLFRLLGTPKENRRHLEFDSGFVPPAPWSHRAAIKPPSVSACFCLFRAPASALSR